MKIKINNIPWKVVFTDKESKRMKKDKDTFFLGLCEYDKARISIRKNQTVEVMRGTVIHELVHAFLFAYGVNVTGDEEMCNFFGAYADEIVRLTDEIMKKGVMKVADSYRNK